MPALVLVGGGRGHVPVHTETMNLKLYLTLVTTDFRYSFSLTNLSCFRTKEKK